MYRKIEDVLNDLKYESESTLKVFDNLTDESLSQKVTEDGRTLGFLAWHITTSIGEMMNRTGLDITA
ncbi:MAG: DinB family protein, partial [Syntrophothermus sp.]